MEYVSKHLTFFLIVKQTHRRTNTQRERETETEREGGGERESSAVALAEDLDSVPRPYM